MKKPVKLDDLRNHFNSVLGTDFDPPSDLVEAAQEVIESCKKQGTVLGEEERRWCLITLINAKLKLNRDRLTTLLNVMAKDRIFPNYHDKAEILECLDRRDIDQFRRWLKEDWVWG